ncbi:MAG: hypothetical protein IPI67_17570 [Myxococcales bacterium]|nr:hypothetical protein [Myxococcales bacterium]
MNANETSAARLRRTLAEIQADRAAWTKRVQEALAYDQRASPLTAEQAATAALALERAYTAFESVLERATRTLEGTTPSGADWHRRLLDGTVLAIHKLRPPILSRQSHDACDTLLGFRHFLRHAYGSDLDPTRVGEIVRALTASRPMLESDLDALESLLASMADVLDRE